MITKKKYVFDLDNTLVYTNLLNNDSYNYALSILGLSQIYNVERITREIVFMKYPNISMSVRNEILRLKQKHFKKNLHRTSLNKMLIKLLLMQKKEDCILWTSASRSRTLNILKFYDIEREFISIIFGKKDNINFELEKIYNVLECKLEQITFYEDDKEVIKKLVEVGANVIEVQL